MNKTCIIVFGRMNPFHKGHIKLFEKGLHLNEITDNSTLKVYLSSNTKGIKNPLSLDEKVYYISKLYPKIKNNIIHETGHDLLSTITAQDGQFDNIIMICGSDRENHYRTVLNSYNNKLYSFNNITVISAGNRESSQYSSTIVRNIVYNNDFDRFIELVPESNILTLRKYYNLIRSKMYDTVSD